MRFLQRLHNRLRIDAAPRRAARDQLEGHEDEGPENKPEPPKEETKQAPEETKEPEQAPPEEQKAPEEEAPPEDDPASDEEEGDDDDPNAVPTGYGELPDGRFKTVLSYKPYLLVVSGAGNNKPELLDFLQRHIGILNNPKVTHRIFGPAKIKPNATKPFDLTLAYLISPSVVNKLTGDLKAPHMAMDLQKKVKSANPFDSLKLSEPLNKAIGDTVNFRKKMLQNMDQLKATAHDEDESFGQINSLQMSAQIPLDYMRFLSFKSEPRQFYVGGHPDNAGQPGMLYVLCEQPEGTLFLKTMKDFKPPHNFADDLYFPMNLDAAFKKTKPRTVKCENALIFEGKQAFKKDEVLDILTGVAEALTNGKSLEEYRKQLSEDAKGGKKKPMLAGRYVDGTVVKGNLKVHFSVDFKKAILWCGYDPVELSKDDEDMLTESLDLASIDKSFSK